MWAMVVTVDVKPGTSAEQSKAGIEAEVVPRASASPGFQRGTWMRHGDADQGMSVVVFDSEEHARAAADSLPVGIEMAGGVATIRSAEVFQILVEA